MKTKLLIASLSVATIVGSASATIVFDADFQSPDVSGASAETTKQRSSLWTASGSGYGSDRHGVLDEDSGAFQGQITPGTNDGEQAYAFRYTSSPSIVSADGSTGWTIADGDTFTLTFDSVEDLNDNGGAGKGLQYDAYIFAIADGATRSGNFGGTGWTQLARLTDSVTQGVTAWETDITLSYTVTGADSAIFGQEIAIAFHDSWIGNAGTAPSSSMIDNVLLDATAVPEPSTFALLAGCFGLAWIMVRRRG